jgi:hypothetical protein
MGSDKHTARRWRSAVRWLLPCIALGALTAVLLAWALTNLGPYLIPEESDYVEHYAPSGAEWARFDCFGGRAFDLFSTPTDPAAAKRRFAARPDVTPAEPPSFAAVPGADDEAALTEMRGWPAVCLYFNAFGHRNGGETTRLLVKLTPRGGRVGLPFGVYWPGMILDIAFYTVPFAALRFAIRARQRSRHRRAGRCPSCGYDRRGIPPDAPCPECGA